ncbi:kinase-like domain-containing protein [Gongronella butleri]|nr:kinase-like domain-containing protein [Gongronella butleri]
MIPSLDDSDDSLLKASSAQHTVPGPTGNLVLRDSPNLSSSLPAYAGPDTDIGAAASGASSNKEKSRHVKPRRVIGNYTLVSTVGSGSMGKVRLAIHNLTQEKLAVKIVPRVGTQDKAVLTEAEAEAKREKDKQREVRTIREASIMLLLHHPHIVSLKELVILDPYYYMFMEYVDGGVLIDYIISHGKLKERHARTFARQILSALDYLHKNSLVHRDLKIENILISRTGQIKIIDFGLSNLFSPHSLLKTFCGSLYFAAPELLNAKAYTGPEVDIWSFGVVLYVLVCGKVPFDDESLAALHQRIKRGIVDYPSHLSTDCKELLSRMLVVNPSHRATTMEIITHPWMNKGHKSLIDNHLPERAPLSLPVDMNVIRGMTGFEFGSEEEIKEQLEAIIQSHEYQQAAATLARRQGEIARVLHDQQAQDEIHLHLSPLARLNNQHTPHDLPDISPQVIPAAYHPLISIYYLVRECMDRELQSSHGNSPIDGSVLSSPSASNTWDAIRRTKSISPRPVHASFSTQLPSTSSPVTRRASPEDFTRRATHTPPPRQTRPRSPTAPSSSSPPSKHVPLISMPEAAHAADSSHRPKPSKPTVMDTHITKGVTYAEKGKTNIRVDAMGRIVDADHRTVLDAYHGLSRVFSKHHTPTPPGQHPPKIKENNGIDENGNDDDNLPLSKLSAAHRPTHGSGLVIDTHLLSLDDNPMKRLGRSLSKKLHHHEKKKYSATSPASAAPSLSSTSPPQASRPRPSFTMAIEGNSRQNARRLSHSAHMEGKHIQFPPPPTTPPPVTADCMSPDASSYHARRQGTADEEIKPVFLKGLFSVSTTSTKHPSVIRADLIRVLERMAIKWRENTRCLECVHLPSIDMHRVTHKSSSSNGTTDTERPTTLAHVTSAASVTVPDLVVRFEIYIVKVSWLPGMYGIQFHRVSGDTWQYKNVCSRILAELKL